jgi:predicted nucleic acid-binding protein
MNAVDTNVLIYSLDRNEAAKQFKAQQLLQQLRVGSVPTILLWQVQAELVYQLRRWRDRGRLTHAEYVFHVQSFRISFPLGLPTPDVLDRAMDLSERYSLSHWDSMLLGACQAAGVTTLYTEDMGAPRKIDGIELISPF